MPNKIWKRIKSLSDSTVTVDTGFMFGALSLRLLFQLGTFVIATRMLGVSDFGLFAAATSIALILSNLVGCGAQITLIRDIARSPSQASLIFNRALGIFFATAPLSLIFYFVVLAFLFDTNKYLIVILLIGISEIVFSSLINAVCNVYQGLEKFRYSARNILLFSIVRLVSALSALSLAHYTTISSPLELLVILNFLLYLLFLIFLLRRLAPDLGRNLYPDFDQLIQRAKDSWPFAFSATARQGIVDLDKGFLAWLTQLDITGAYSAAYRIVDVALFPANALISVITPKIFVAGRSDILASFRIVSSYAILPIIYSLLVALGILFVAEYLTLFIGPSFILSTTILPWLSLLPLFVTIRTLLQRILGSSGHQHYSALVLGTALVLNCGLNMVLIPSFSWFGAVLSTYVAEIGILVLFVIRIYALASKNRLN